ncbi:MAG: hypothetical protein M3040_13655 [Bacteroidota bacterium]|nr:hypothetical protein [Bacteroidota bacterium]
MNELKGQHFINSLRRRWNRQTLVANCIIAVAAIIFVLAVIAKFVHENTLPILAVLIVVSFVLVLVFVKNLTQQDVVRFLNKVNPSVEESSNLLLKPYASLNMLEQLQVKKIQNELKEDVPSPAAIKRKIKVACAMLVVSMLLDTALFFIPKTSIRTFSHESAFTRLAALAKPETKLAQVEEAVVKISPPPYTSKGPREQDKFNIVAEQGAFVLWSIETNRRAREVQLLFNDKSILRLQPDNIGTKWVAQREIKKTGFYQLKIDNSLSELYQLEMIKDQPPVVVLKSPKPNTVIEYGQPQQVTIDVALSDDYGVESAFIHATTASGSGEAVKFKERQISFSNFSPGNKQYQLQKQLDLPSLGMQPGDELYFYINAKDSYQQEKRSDVYIVKMEDTAQLMSISGLVSGVDQKPEFFRSERQIIIETEQLLKDRDTITAEGFNKKSTDLGVDQKLLRLRYGKFLGEESETEIGGDDDHNTSANNSTADFNNAGKILDQYSHKHDIAEDATFFDAQTKKQLLATLSEMWKAELQLRTLKPREALPFEYKALRLLKDLQQSTRAYVGKTSTKTTPLKPEIRLTGDLTKVTEPVVVHDYPQKPDVVSTLRKALGVLEQVRNKEDLQKTSVEILEQASMQLSAMAASDPSAYLASLQAMRRILKKDYKIKDVNIAGTALQKIIRSVSDIPQQSKSAPDALSQHYFQHLNRNND